MCKAVGLTLWSRRQQHRFPSVLLGVHLDNEGRLMSAAIGLCCWQKPCIKELRYPIATLAIQCHCRRSTPCMTRTALPTGAAEQKRAQFHAFDKGSFASCRIRCENRVQRHMLQRLQHLRMNLVAEGTGERRRLKFSCGWWRRGGRRSRRPQEPEGRRGTTHVIIKITDRIKSLPPGLARR